MQKRILLAALLAAAAVVRPAHATLASTCNSSTQTGNGVTKAFTFSCKFLQNADISVTVAGVTKTQPTDYTVSGAGNASGTITFTTAPANGAAVVITRTVDYQQRTSLRLSRTYDPGTVENALDKAAMQAQQLQNLYTNPPATVLPANVAAKLNNIRFADQFANIQAAITDAGTTGAVLIPSSYAGSDTFTNPNGVPILDLRGGPGRWRGCVNVTDYGADPSGVADSAGPIQTADAQASGKALCFPAGSYKWVGPGTTYTAVAGSWLGPGDSGDPSGTNGAILKFSGANGGNPYVAPPRTTQNMTFDGIDKTGKGLVMGTEGFFTGHQRWRNLVVRNFSTGIKCYNFFNVAWENISIQSNSEGVRIDPLNQPGVNGGDNGYFTSTHWKNVYIAFNTSFGLLVNTPLGTKNWVLDNVVVEQNGASGTFQTSLTSTEFVANGLYLEGTPTKPAIVTNSASLTITDGYFNGTGGIDTTSNSIRLDFFHVLMNTGTDVIANLSALSYVRAFNSALQTDVKGIIGSRAIITTSTVAGTLVGRQLSDSVSGDYGDTSPTLTLGSDQTVARFATTLTANRTVTLSTTGAARGDKFRIVRTGLGAFTLNVGGLKTIPSATAAFVDVMYDGSAWQLTGYGTL